MSALNIAAATVETATVAADAAQVAGTVAEAGKLATATAAVGKYAQTGANIAKAHPVAAAAVATVAAGAAIWGSYKMFKGCLAKRADKKAAAK